MPNSLLKHVQKFFDQEISSGILTIISVFVALYLANSGYAPKYQNAVEMLHSPVNDWTMIIFFLVIALELKGEMFDGMLKDFRQSLLPLLAALGGMLFPAVIYMVCNIDSANSNGWAIPCATDIALALAVLLLAGAKAPPYLKIFLLSLAIFDDLGAIIIIALFYSDKLALLPLGFSILTIAIMYMMNRGGVKSPKAYIIFGAILAYLLYVTGIHTTIAGVITGFMMPYKRDKKFMHALHPYSAFLIVPVFAFVNAGISFDGFTFGFLTQSIPLGIMLGLFFGKQIGVFLTTYIAVKTKIAALPAGIRWRDIYAVAVIAGIGFTMSLFIGVLAFQEDMQQVQVKIGVLFGSFFSAILGMILLKLNRK